MARAHIDDTPPDDLNLDNGGTAIATANAFIVATDRTIYAAWFWPPTTNTGTYTLELYEVDAADDPGPAAGTLLASKAVAAANVTPGQWNRVEFDTPIPVLAASAYRISRHASSGRFVRTAGAFNGASISNGGITLLESGTDVGGRFVGVLRNGVFREGATGYPSSVFGQPDYYVDVDDEGEAPDAISVAGAITVGDPVVSGAAVESLRVTGAVAVGNPTVVGTAVLAIRATGAVSVDDPVVSGAIVQVTPVAVAGAVVVGDPVVSAVVSTPVTVRPPGFEPLAAMFRNARTSAGQRVPTEDCPLDGWPLDSARGVRHCGFCGRVYA